MGTASIRSWLKRRGIPQREACSARELVLVSTGVSMSDRPPHNMHLTFGGRLREIEITAYHGNGRVCATGGVLLRREGGRPVSTQAQVEVNFRLL